MPQAFIALGANLGDPSATIARAIERLGELGRLGGRARLYGSCPVGGPSGQRDFVNTAVALTTDLDPPSLLSALKRIERELGRTEGPRWGPRVIDLDVLLYEDQVISSQSLTVPHARLCERRFVLMPLADLAPARVVPGTDRTVKELLDALEDDENTVWPLA